MIFLRNLVFILAFFINYTKNQEIFKPGRLYNNYIFINFKNLNKGLVGCFKFRIKDNEFFTFSPHSSGQEASPLKCNKGCLIMGFELAATKESDLCFCKRGFDIKMEQINHFNCQQNICKGDSNYYCGSDTSVLVYSTQIFIQVNF